MNCRSCAFRVLVLLAGIAAWLVLGLSATAHDGGFGHSRRTLDIAPNKDGFSLEYRLKQNPDEALVEMTLVDADRDGQVTDAERDGYFNERGSKLAAGLAVRSASGKRVVPQLVSYRLDHSLVQTYQFRLVTPAQEISLEDHNFVHKPGQISVRAAESLHVELARETDLSHAETVSLRIRRLEK